MVVSIFFSSTIYLPGFGSYNLSDQCAFQLLISYPIIYWTSYTRFHRDSFSLSLFLDLSFFLSLFCDIVSSHNLSPGFSDSIKLPCSPHAFFSCHRMSSFLLFLRLSTAFEFDETFPVVPRIPPFATLSHTATRSLCLLLLPPPLASDSSSSILSV